MMTIVFEAPRAHVDRYASEHLVDPVIRTAGRLTAVQSSSFDDLDELAVREIAEAYNLPLRSVLERPPFPRPKVSTPPVRARGRAPRPSRLALPSAGRDG